MKTTLARLSLACISLTLIGLIFTGQSSAVVILADTLAIWLFDEGQGDVAADSSGNDYDGKLMNAPKWVDGKFGTKGLDFDGMDDLVRVEFPSITLSSWAVSVWIFPRNPRVGHHQGIVQAWPNGGEFQIQASTSAVGVHPVYGGSLIEDEWSHVAVSVESGTLSVYINGEEVTQGTVGAVTFAEVGLGDLYECPAGFNYKFDGIMDDVAVFSKALTKDDVENIITNGLGIALGLTTSVEPSRKLTTTWSTIRAY